MMFLMRFWGVLRWKLSTISGRSDFRKVFWFSFYFKSQIWTGCTEIRVHIFIFFQNANLAVQIFGKVFAFSFLMKIKMWTPFLSKSVQKRCSHFDFHQKRKCEHLSKNLDGQICDLKKLKMWTPFQKSGRLDLRFEWKWKCEHLTKIWTARNCWEFPPLVIWHCLRKSGLPSP